ncbi:YihY/virulence factor BrkB family protein [Halostagnicola sp. A-GB9-2]|uniref:YihY/virulence factor BrkB family protein n=1 Tax=Halostagnicola sp. A-GB9-2 TaxID=3048066 RepID=UPI0024BF8DB2|nr:YihY/virulence factor BrkB family protein [Halostagnicola sp. A-GB9-2]MDJ1433874.1 YihY/virulence factor BrkB family protein [Halostagnicola sp. A-GB9-2]
MIPSSIRTLATDVTAVARERQISVKSAGLAYHAFNTLVPLVILLLVAVTILESLEVVLEALETATGLEGTIGRDQLDEAAGDGANRTRAALLALGILLWSAARLFQAVNSAFTAVYGSRQSQSSIKAALSASFVTILYAFLLTVTVAVGVALVGFLGVSVSLFFEGPLAMAASTIALTGLLFVLFVPMYYVFPEPDVSIREVLPGTAFAAVTWSILAVGFRIYVLTSESVALFDIAGAILLVLTWVYFGGLCLLLGAVLNAVLAGRVDPDDGWVPMSEELAKTT